MPPSLPRACPPPPPFSQTAVPFAALREASLSIGRAAHERGLIGHLGIDFVSFVDSHGQLRLWAVDLNLRLTHTAVTFGFFDLSLAH